MEIFSRRHQYDPQIPRDPVIKDAPKVLRLEYYKKVLILLTYIDGDSRYSRDKRPLGIKELCEELCLLFHEEPSDNLWDSWFCTEELKGLIMSSPWYHFFDAIEYIGQKLIKIEQDESLDLNPKLSFGFYKEITNGVLANNFVVWRINNSGVLEREIPKELQKDLRQIEKILETNFSVALSHIRKARRFVLNRPLDPENAIKEAISAVESYGRALYPGTSTLGDVVKKLRKTPFSPLMVIIIEKFYAFASSEPGVRHGGTVSSRISLADADFCLYVAVALIGYLNKLHSKKPKKEAVLRKK